MNAPYVLAEMPPVLIGLLLVAGFGLIVLLVILLKRHVKVFKSDEKPKSDKEIAAEELDRILEPVEELEPKVEEEEAQEDDTPKA
ncbi:MAG: hypothetical protein IJ787_00025 [Bacilli bacterium]|nr:hypothetical protein [Bacilli bacterium]MDY6392620.1 hypothetical protein [Bacilli bacterium]